MIKVKQLSDGFLMTDKADLLETKLGPVTVCPFQWLLAPSSDRAAVAPGRCTQSRVAEEANAQFLCAAGGWHRLTAC